MDDFTAPAELLPVCAHLFPLCRRSAAGTRLLARELSHCLAAAALPAVLQGRLGPGSAPFEAPRSPLMTAGSGRAARKVMFFPKVQVVNSEIR